jgi:hypothetical protein
MWHHIAHFNLIRCENPLHRFHYEPVDPDLPIDPHYLYLASKYLLKTFRCFDNTFGIAVAVPSSHAALVTGLRKLREAAEEDAADSPRQKPESP